MNTNISRVSLPQGEDRSRRFLEIFRTIIERPHHDPVFDRFVRSGAKCVRCAASCQIYLATSRPEDLPCEVSELLLRVYRRNFTVKGRLRSRLSRTPPVCAEDIAEMAKAFYRCTACRGCSHNCQLGIDHNMVILLGRHILSEMGILPKTLHVAVRQHLAGASAIPVRAFLDTLSFLEGELKESLGKDVKFPIDVEGAEYVFFPAAGDYLLEPETLMGQAAVFHATGESWTMGTGCFQGIDCGVSYDDPSLEEIARKQLAEVRRLKGRKILIGECGHAVRTAASPTPGGGQLPPAVGILEFTADAIRGGRLRLDKTAVKERVTYHDPCAIAPSDRIGDRARSILRSFVADFVEMVPGDRQDPCGGGREGPEEMEVFHASAGGALRAEQLRATGARYVVAPCARCKKRLREVIEEHRLDMKVVGLHDLVLRASRP